VNLSMTLPLFDDAPELAPVARASPLPPAVAAGHVAAAAMPTPFTQAELIEPPEPAATPFFMAAPETLHPALWRANQLGSGCTAVTASGFAALDEALPGGGWPHRVLTELLLPHPGLGEMRLLAPALAGLGTADGAPARHSVMLFNPPSGLCGWALGQIGLDVRHWLVVQGRDVRARLARRQLGDQAGSGRAFDHASDARARRPPWQPGAPRALGPGADLLWALEQALKSGHLGAALAWLPSALPGDALRRLQLAAQAHDGPVFVFREAQAHSRPSVAPLRLLLAPAGLDALSLRVFKRRGPPLAEPLRLALPPVLTEQLRQRAEAAQLAQHDASHGAALAPRRA
jgi:protein ImuA